MTGLSDTVLVLGSTIQTAGLPSILNWTVPVGVPSDPLRAPQVIEVRMADQDPIGGSDVVGPEPGAGRARDPVDVRVEHDDDLVEREPERRAAQPVQRRVQRP